MNFLFLLKVLLIHINKNWTDMNMETFKKHIINKEMEYTFNVYSQNILDSAVSLRKFQDINYRANSSPCKKLIRISYIFKELTINH